MTRKISISLFFMVFAGALGTSVWGHLETVDPAHAPERVDFSAERASRVDPPARPMLSAPTMDGWRVASLWKGPADDAQVLAHSRAFPLFATARHHLAPVFHQPSRTSQVWGYVRSGQSVRARQPGDGAGDGGGWIEVDGGGFASEEDFEIAARPEPTGPRLPPPDLGRIEPFRFAKADKGSLRLTKLPSPEQARTWREQGDPPMELVHTRMDGAYFLALVRSREVGGVTFWKTAMGRWVRQVDVRWLEPTGMHGELLGPEHRLPIAFVYADDARLECRDPSGAFGTCGPAPKHARFRLMELVRDGDREMAVGPHGMAVERDKVRIARSLARPSRVPAGAKWMHVNLAEQTLVAYEGPRPVMATLVSSGIDSHATPTGTYRLRRRYITKTMTGPDPDHGVYEVAEVPWTFFYKGNYAIHGAYWHDVFGNQRSHGCTNIPPADARWLFGWLDPRLPEGFHARLYQEQAWAHFTD